MPIKTVIKNKMKESAQKISNGSTLTLTLVIVLISASVSLTVYTQSVIRAFDVRISIMETVLDQMQKEIDKLESKK